MKLRTRFGLLIGGLGLLAGGIAFAAPGASAAAVCAPLATAGDHSYVSPIHGGQALDAIGWGGSGSKAMACTGAVVNDEIRTFQYPAASVAADFTPVATGIATVQLVYTPGNQVSTTAPLCVSTVLDQLKTAARLRPCAGLTVTVNLGTGLATIVPTTGNLWQNFSADAVGDGFFQLEASTEPAPGPFSLNISGAGGNGTPVISWFPLVNENCGMNGSCADNEIFEALAAA